MLSRYGIYAPYVGDLVDCRVGTVFHLQRDLFIRGLTTEGELVACIDGIVYHLSFESVRNIFASRLREIESAQEITLGPMTDSDVIDSFVSGVFFERAGGPWSYSAVDCLASYPRMAISIFVDVGPEHTYMGRYYFPDVMSVIKIE